jgi:hypothetical protein
VDPVDRLIAVWTWWDTHPTSRAAAVAKQELLTALGLNSKHVHRGIAECRRRPVLGQEHGMALPDAIQTYWLENHHEAT